MTTTTETPETAEVTEIQHNCFICGGAQVIQLTAATGALFDIPCAACKHGRSLAEAPSPLASISVTDPLWQLFAERREKNLAALPGLHGQLRGWRERQRAAYTLRHAADERQSLLRSLLPTDHPAVTEAIDQQQVALDYEQVAQDAAREARHLLRITIDTVASLEQVMGIGAHSDLTRYREALGRDDYY